MIAVTPNKDDKVSMTMLDQQAATPIVKTGRLPLPLLTSGGLLQLLAKAPLTHISVAGDQRDVALKVKLYPAYIT